MEKGVYLQPEVGQSESYLKRTTDKITAGKTILQNIVTAYSNIGVTVTTIDEIVLLMDQRTRKVNASAVTEYVNTELGTTETPDISAVLSAYSGFVSYEYEGFFRNGVFSTVYSVNAGTVSVGLSDYDSIVSLIASINSLFTTFKADILEG